jgi:hypothetical protein
MLNAHEERAMLVRFNACPHPSQPKMRRLEFSVHQAVYQLTGILLRDIQNGYLDKPIVAARDLMTFGLVMVLGMSKGGAGRYLQRDRASVRRAIQRAVHQQTGNCSELWRLCGPISRRNGP